MPKGFSQRVPLGNGLYEAKLGGVQRVPYCLSELLERKARDTVFIVEGEKDADALRALGFCATTNAQGAAWKWTPEFVDHFQDAKCVVFIADCDEPGRKAVQERAALVAQFVDNVRIADLDAARQDGFDISDWLEQGHRSDELRALAEESPLYSSKPVVIDAVDLLAKPFQQPEFIVKHLIPSSSVILLTGDTGAGKTAFAIHVACAIASDQPIAELFAVKGGSRVLYCNGEMGSQDTTRFVKEAIAGIGHQPERGRLIFEGVDAVATFNWRNDAARSAFEQLVEKMRPTLIIFDTQRALLVEDENDQVEVRRVFSWIRSAIVNPFGTSVLVAHHLRKIGQVSNNDRERVSGSRDIIASVDVHLAVQAASGRPMHALSIGKTRTPVDNIKAGVTWPIEARLIPGQPSRSIFIAGDPATAESDASAEDAAADEIRARLTAEGALTIAELGVRVGARKRAWGRLQKAGEVCETGKRGRKTIYGLSSAENRFDEVAA